MRILIVDDDPAVPYLLREVRENLRHRHELYFVGDGIEALDFLQQRGAYGNAPHPDLILLDIHMPRLNGLETLAAVKNNPRLCTVPVIMLSSADSPEEVRGSYAAHANCYIQKPTDLEGFVKLLQAVEAFWLDLALLPPADEPPEQLQTVDF